MTSSPTPSAPLLGDAWLVRFATLWLILVFTVGLFYFSVEWIGYGHVDLAPVVMTAWGAIATAAIGFLGWLTHRYASNGH